MLATWPLSQAIVTASQLVSVILPQSAALRCHQTRVPFLSALDSAAVISASDRMDRAQARTFIPTPVLDHPLRNLPDKHHVLDDQYHGLQNSTYVEACRRRVFCGCRRLDLYNLLGVVTAASALAVVRQCYQTPGRRQPARSVGADLEIDNVHPHMSQSTLRSPRNALPWAISDRFAHFLSRSSPPP